MKEKRSITELQLQFKKLEEEKKENETFHENYKKKLSQQIKNFNPKEIKNTPVIEKKYNIWQRIMKTLGMI